MDYKKIFKNISTGVKARQESGFTPAFIDSSLEISKKFGTGLSFRDGNPPIPFGQFKPMKLKTKTASMGVVPMMTARKIVVDRDLHRAGSKDVPDEYTKKSDEPKNWPSHNKGSLRLLFADPNIKIIEINEKGELIYQMKNVVEEDCFNPEVAKNTRYMIKLTEPMDPPKLNEDELAALRNTFRSKLESAKIPEDLMPTLKKFGAVDLDKEYHTYYQKVRDTPYVPEMVVGDPPFSGDADMFSVSIPLHLAKTPLNKSQFIKYPKDIKKFFQKLEKIRKIIKPRLEQQELADVTTRIKNKNIVEEKEKFKYDMSQFGELSFFEKLHMPSQEVLKIIEDLEVFLSTENLSGIATQYEFIVGAAINRVAGKSIVGDMIKNMILHGPETNNPNEPSSLDDKILHFYDGQVYMTHSEEELVAFYMETSYLEKNFQPVHHGWNMDLWHDIITKQISLGQADLIKPKTLLAYIRHAQENELTLPALNKKSKLKLVKALKILNNDRKDKDINDFMINNNLHFTSKRMPLVKKMSSRFELQDQKIPLVKKRSRNMSKKFKDIIHSFSPKKRSSKLKDARKSKVKAMIDRFETKQKKPSPIKKSQNSHAVISKSEFLDSLKSQNEDEVVQSIVDYIKNVQDYYVQGSKKDIPMYEKRMDLLKQTNLKVNEILNDREDLTPKEKVSAIKDLLSEQKSQIQNMGQQLNDSSISFGMKKLQEVLIADQEMLHTYDELISSVDEAYEQQYSQDLSMQF